MSVASGATPEILPIGAVTWTPAAVDDTWVPWPLSSRGSAPSPASTWAYTTFLLTVAQAAGGAAVLQLSPGPAGFGVVCEPRPLPLNIGWSQSMPVSITAISSPAPLL